MNATSLWALSAPLALAMKGCVTPPAAPVPRLQPPDPVAVEQRLRPDGTTYFASCVDCRAPTPKSAQRARPALGLQPAAPASAVQSDLAPEAEVPIARAMPLPAAPDFALASVSSGATTVAIQATLYFDSNSSVPTPGSVQRLAELEPLLRRMTRASVTGYTDRTGSAAHNQRLAAARAADVAQRLVAWLNSAASGRIDQTARPQCCYVSGKRAPAQHRADRRVEIEFRMPVAEDLDALMESIAGPVRHRNSATLSWTAPVRARLEPGASR